MSNTGPEKGDTLRLNALTLVLTGIGTAVFLAAVVRQSVVSNYGWVAMVVLALFLAPTGAIYVPGVKVRLTFGDMATFTCAALFGSNAAVIAAVVDGAITSLKLTSSLRKFAYNISTYAISMSIAGWLTAALFPSFGSYTVTMSLLDLLLAMGLFTLCNFVITTVLVCAYMNLLTGEPFFRFWKDNLLWTALSYMAAGASAVAVRFLVQYYGYYIFIVPVGLMLTTYLFYRTYFRKVESANERADRIEEQLRQAQKMEAVGRLAGGVAHDFNNLLTAIIGYSDFLLLNLDDLDPMRKNVEEIKKAGDRAASLTRQLLAFSRKQVLQPKVINLNSIVADMDKMLGRLLGESTELITFTDARLGQVKADPGQVEQVIMNLALNARDAMPAGGKIVIETANVYLDEKYAREHISVEPGPYVMLAVTDTGEGMDEETQRHIFEPFFTTKEQGKGTGLGLSTVYGIITQSGGSICVDSRVGYGSTFKVFLPRISEAVEGKQAAGLLGNRMAKTETILLVEDEDMVRRLVREVLKMNGYTVLEAANGVEALQISEYHKGPIHLMVTDVVMPQMNGRALAERLALLRPNTKVLYVSGYTEDTIMHLGISDAGMNFLQKPFTPDTLARKVREILDPMDRSEDQSPEIPQPAISDRKEIMEYTVAGKDSVDMIH